MSLVAGQLTLKTDELLACREIPRLFLGPLLFAFFKFLLKRADLFFPSGELLRSVIKLIAERLYTFGQLLDLHVILVKLLIQLLPFILKLGSEQLIFFL